MPFKPGHKKTGGRKKGTPNKRPPEIQTILDEKGFCPVEQAIRIHRLAMQRFRNKRYRMSHATYLSIALDAVQDVMQYAHPKRKAVEFKGDVAEAMAASLAALVKASAENDGGTEPT